MNVNIILKTLDPQNGTFNPKILQYLLMHEICTCFVFVDALLADFVNILHKFGLKNICTYFFQKKTVTVKE